MVAVLWLTKLSRTFPSLGKSILQPFSHLHPSAAAQSTVTRVGSWRVCQAAAAWSSAPCRTALLSQGLDWDLVLHYITVSLSVCIALSPPTRQGPHRQGGMSWFAECIALISCWAVAADDPAPPPAHAPCQALTKIQAPTRHQAASWRCHLVGGG